MANIADTSVKIQATSEPNPSTPCWFGEVVVISSSLRKHHILSKINERVRFARKRFGRYEVIDFIGLLVPGHRTTWIYSPISGTRSPSLPGRSWPSMPPRKE
jgi:hypothetical protein